jgi:glycosyltransferase involved in cell wall biosynthesis
MTILLAHNYYQHRGGEDAVFEAEAALLQARGHTVIRYAVHNDDVRTDSLADNLALARATVFNRTSYDALCTIIREQRPDVVHVHNTLPLLSAAVFYAANALGVPVLQTLHNYRLLCPNALFFRDGRVCEDCLGATFALGGVRHGCYRGSKAASAVVAGTTAWHTLSGTWRNRVDAYIALTEFAREKFIAGGLPAEKIIVKPNFVTIDDGAGNRENLENTENSENSENSLHTRTDALFVGRLSPEKGILTLLRAWKLFMEQQSAFSAASSAASTATATLRIVGDGPLESEIRRIVSSEAIPNVVLLGRKTPTEVLEQMRTARCLVFPSELYETFGKSMIEAFACGTPVICSRLGAMQEIVSDYAATQAVKPPTGFLAEAGNAESFAQSLRECWALPAADYATLCHNARQTYHAHYTAERSGTALETIYTTLIKTKAASMLPA